MLKYTKSRVSRQLKTTYQIISAITIPTLVIVSEIGIQPRGKN